MPFFTASFLSSAVVADFRFGVQLPGKEFLDIIHRCMGDIVQSLSGQVCLVGGDDDVGHGNEPD